jgi:hypothetical protein
MISHIAVGKMSVLEAAHWPSYGQCQQAVMMSWGLPEAGTIYLDESRACPFHCLHKKTVPPDRSGPLIIAIWLATADPYGRNHKYYWHKDDD